LVFIGSIGSICSIGGIGGIGIYLVPLSPKRLNKPLFTTKKGGLPSRLFTYNLEPET
jgi:hypothetical protein